MQRLLFCYVSGLDRRHVNDRTTPFLAEAESRFPLANFTNLPSNELFPTLVTGAHPAQHGVWGTRLRRDAAGRAPLEVLPDIVATTLQCLAHFSGRTYDLAAIPPRRRKRFEITRTKYKRRVRRPEALHRIGGQPTIFDIVGADRSEYFFDAGYAPERSVLPRVCNERHRLEVIELYSLDRHQQWNADQPSTVLEFYRHVDGFLAMLHRRCETRGWRLMIVSDHGHEPIRQSHDLRAALAGLPHGDEEYSYFLEVSSARFWFHSEAARRAIIECLRRIPAATLVHHDEMARHGIPLPDDAYGELFVYLDPGHIFFPHDFHQPLANLWLGITDPVQRARLRGPRHRGNHGHLPHFEAERSFALLCDDGYTARQDGTILDVAPSALALLGHGRPPGMTGRPLFELRAA